MNESMIDELTTQEPSRIGQGPEKHHMRDIIKAATKTGTGSAASMTFGAIAAKIMAVILGPGGIGLYSILVQVQQTATTAGTLGGSTAVVQGTASREGPSRDVFISTAFWIFVVTGVSVSLGLALFAPWIAPLTIGEGDESSIGLVRWLALPVMLSVLLTYLMSLLNGMRAIGRLAIVQVAVSATIAVLAYPVSQIVDSGYAVAFIALMSSANAVGIAIGLSIAIRRHWLKSLRDQGFRPRFEKEASRSFFTMATTLFVTSMVATATLLITRSLIVHYQGIDAAGIFNVAWTLGMVYPLVVLTSFGTYYFPTLSQERDPVHRKELMHKILKLSTFFMIPFLTAAIVLKPLIIGFLYSESFIASLETVRWMFVGDYLKTASYVFGMPMLAYADMRVFFWTENLWYLGFGAFAVTATALLDDIQVVGLGFLVLYAAYLVYTRIYARRKYGFVAQRRTESLWLGGFALVVLASWLTWSETRVDWLIAAVMIGISIAYSYLVLDRSERRRAAEFLGLR